MAERYRLFLIHWFCLSLLMCFLLPPVFAAAKAPSPISPTAAQNPAQPGPASQKEQKTPDQPNSAAGEAAAVASIAKLAVDMNNETVKRIEAFYANTEHNFETHFSIGVAVISFVVAVMRAVGAYSVLIVTERTAKR
jgi:hypothetical protein